MIKKIVAILFLIFAGLFIATHLSSVDANEKLSVHFFWGHGCPHCDKEKEFLEKLEIKYPEVIFNKYEIYYNQENQQKMIDMGKELSINVQGVPFIVIGDKYLVGFLNEETSGKEIESAIINALAKNDEKEEVKQEVRQPIPPPGSISQIVQLGEENGKKISLPIFGEINSKDFSLPVLTIIVALLDGFNPCAMWTLFFLISLLLGMEDKKRMWILGTVFIATSAFVYFLFLSAWLNFFLFLGFAVWVRVIIGTFALIAGGYYLKDFFLNKNAVCKVAGNEKRQKVFEKMKLITQKRQLVLAVFGMILLAFAVNMVELICSAGLPAIYTQILALSNLPKIKYYAYLLLYILIFMLDDLIVFFTAMITLKAVGLDSKYSKFSHLIGGILMFLIGILLLFKPELLMFG